MSSDSDTFQDGSVKGDDREKPGILFEEMFE